MAHRMLPTLVLLATAAATPPPGFDCEWRRHAWEFAKKTLPQRGQFRTAFDALQLAKCQGAPDPLPPVDRYRSPKLPTPPGRAWFVDPAAPAAGGDGSKSAPFSTLAAGVAAAAAVPGPKALLLRAGTHQCVPPTH